MDTSLQRDVESRLALPVGIASHGGVEDVCMNHGLNSKMAVLRICPARNCMSVASWAVC